MLSKSEKETQFLAIAGQYKPVISKVCFLYQSPSASFEDLYQEVLLNLWQGLDSFRGDAKISTWIYRTALNTCISWHRRNGKYSASRESIEDMLIEPAESSTDEDLSENYRKMLSLIAALGPLDKALITLWLDGNPYDEIARVTGLTTANVAVKLHRIKEKLATAAKERCIEL